MIQMISVDTRHISVQIHFNITLPSMLMFSKWSLSFRIFHVNLTCVSLLPHTCHVPRESHPA